MHADDLGTFVRNGGYYFDEQVEMKFLGPRNEGGNGQRTAEQRRKAAASTRAITTANDGVWSQAELGSTSSAPSGPALLECALRRATNGEDRNLAAYSRRERERERDEDFWIERGRDVGTGGDGRRDRRECHSKERRIERVVGFFSHVESPYSGLSNFILFIFIYFFFLGVIFPFYSSFF